MSLPNMRLQVYTANAVIVFLICDEKVKVANIKKPPIAKAERLRTQTCVKT